MGKRGAKLVEKPPVKGKQVAVISRPAVAKVEPAKVEAPKPALPKAEAPKVVPAKIEAPKVAAPRIETSRVEAPKVAPVSEPRKVEAPTTPPVNPAPLAPIEVPAHQPPMIVEAPVREEPSIVAPPPVVVEPPPAQVEAASQAPPLPPFLFEVAWEVCWQLGGIYTVLKTKAEMMLRKWGDRYCLVGPYNPQTAAVEFEEQQPEGIVAEAIRKLGEQGLHCHYGRWLIAGRPRVILIDYRGRYGRLDTDKYLLWKDHGIGTVAGDGEVNEVTAFGFSATELFRQLKSAAGNRPIVAHFHEWMAGVAVPRIAHERIDVLTVFTTHATLLGRYLASDSYDFYGNMPFVNPDAEAQKYLIYPRFQIERAAAHASTVFTTVSEVTGVEAEKLLGRKPDLILPNGLNIKRFAALHEFQNLHRKYKEKIHEFVMGHFFPSYTFDLDNTLYLFTSGRYEYRNKGMDLFIEAMQRLNQRLKWMPERPTIVAFIVTKAATRNINVGVLQNQSMFEELKKLCEQVQEHMGQRLFDAAAHGRLPTINELMDEDERVRLKQGIYAWRSGRQPPIVTHDMVDDGNDPILQHLRHRGLFNSADDPVKMIFHPQFVSSTSPLISLDYDQFVRGCHMGIFPSYYEPWGYTPMESIALGVPAVTTDLSGFGAYVLRHLPDHEENGILVLQRRYKSFDEAADHLVDHLVRFAMMTRRQRIELRNRVERLGERFDWSALISHYHEAHELAMNRGGLGMRVGRLELKMV